MYEKTLVGNLYTVHVRMTVNSHKEYSHGDHYAGDGEYSTYYGRGEATVRDGAGNAIAVCSLGYDNTNKHGHLRAVSDAVFKSCVEAEDMLPQREKAYADWFAEKLIAQFRASKQGGVPGFSLIQPDRTELIEHGFILDEDGQARLPLWDTKSLLNA